MPRSSAFYALALGAASVLSALAGVRQSTAPDWLIFHHAADEASDVWIAHGSRTRAVVRPADVRFIIPGGPDLSMELVGRNGSPHFEGRQEAGTFTRIGGAEPAHSTQAWQTIECRDIYPGIHLKYAGAAGSLKSEYYVEPGSSPSSIRMRYSGAKAAIQDGDLVLKGPAGVLREHKPEVHQTIGGRRVQIGANYRIDADGTVGFDLDPYDRSAPLVIDPQMDFSTVWGGALSDAVTGVAIGSDGSMYATGWTSSADLLTTASLKQSPGGSLDGFVVKISAAGAVVYATYIGGSGYEKANAIAVDSAGAVYLTGLTDSVDYPTASAFQTKVVGAHDAFVLKLDATGRSLVYSTLIGGAGNDQGNAIQVDSTGAAYVAGETDSGDFPTTSAYQRASGGGTDGFVLKLQPSGALAFSTYLGGYGTDRALAIAVRNGEAYVTGTTDSPNFPTQAPLQGTIKGSDAFVSKLNAAGTALVYSTFLGGSDGASASLEQGLGIAVDGAGQAYVTGVTASTDFPTVAAVQPAFGGGSSDAFVLKLNAAGSALVFSTFLGGLGLDRGEAIALDPDGNAFIGGTTWSSDFPLVSPLSTVRGGTSDAFLTGVEAAGNGFFFSTYWGGRGAEASVSIAVQQTSVVIGGQTQSVDFILNKAVQPRDAGASGFITRFAVGDTTLAITVAAAPAGRTVTVDGTNYTAPQSFQWRSGSTHTICTTSPQSGTSQIRYVWATWSDGGAMCHSVMAQSTTSTYTATFTTQYQLLSAANPTAGGSVTPASGSYYDAGTTVALTATANPLYVFGSWTGDASGTSPTASVMMNGPKSVTAGFLAGLPTITITSPTSAGTWSAIASPLTVGGSAAGANAIAQITWSNDRGGSGTATGTTSWSASVALFAGANTITVTARDSAGATRAATLGVTLGVAPTSFALTSPANAASSLPTSTSLSWTSAAGATSYDVYLGAANPPPLVATSTTTSYAPATLSSNTTYYWKIVAKNTTGSTPSSVWSFTTAAATGSGTGLAFTPITPCRVVDTREAEGITGEFGPPVMGAWQTRTFHLNAGRCSGIPKSVGAYSVNVTVVPAKNLAFLSIWPHGQPQPLVSTLNAVNGGIVANAAIVPAGTDGAVDVVVTDQTHVIIDVNGYFN